MLNLIRKASGGESELTCKPYSEMTAEERRARVQEKCDIENRMPGNLHEKDGYNCPLCLNRGYTWEVKEIDRGEETNDFSESTLTCKCKTIRASIMRMKRSGLENVLERYTFAKYAAGDPWQKHVKETARRFVEEGGSVFFIGGQTGAGKTHICTAITAEFLRRGKAAYYMLWQDETVKLKANITDGPEHERQMKRLKNVDVLYIDDFFKPVGETGPSPADVRIAYELINYRYNNAGLITVISSERLINEILDIDEATGGRLVEYAGEYMINIGRDKARNYRLRNAGMI